MGDANAPPVTYSPLDHYIDAGMAHRYLRACGVALSGSLILAIQKGGRSARAKQGVVSQMPHWVVAGFAIPRKFSAALKRSLKKDDEPMFWYTHTGTCLP